MRPFFSKHQKGCYLTVQRWDGSPKIVQIGDNFLSLAVTMEAGSMKIGLLPMTSIENTGNMEQLQTAG